MFLLLGGLIHFKESFRPIQWAGLAVLVIGLLLYFNNRLQNLTQLNGDYYFGVIIIVVAAFIWASYALAQKQLMRTFRSDQVLLIIYAAAVILLFPTAGLAQIQNLDGFYWALLVFCSVNTLVAYGSFAEAMVHWEASRVSAVLAVAPLITLFCIWLLAKYHPGFITPEKLNDLSILGAALVIIGSMLAALGRKRGPKNGRSTPPLIE
jgi:drug/metabolite transporter (DMT)-like permease